MNISDETADKLLDRLGSDDDFRALFQKDPRQALAAVGHAPAADSSVEEGAWSCMSVSSLASKEQIRASRDTMRKHLVSARASAVPISLDVSRR